MGILVAFTGCDVGEVPSNTPDGGSNGSASFQTNIVPLVTECVMGSACHTIQAPVMTSFDALAPKYKMKPGAQNILVTKGSLTAGMHSGLPYLTAAEQATVSAWIDSL